MISFIREFKIYDVKWIVFIWILWSILFVAILPFIKLCPSYISKSIHIKIINWSFVCNFIIAFGFSLVYSIPDLTFINHFLIVVLTNERGDIIYLLIKVFSSGCITLFSYLFNYITAAIRTIKVRNIIREIVIPKVKVWVQVHVLISSKVRA